MQDGVTNCMLTAIAHLTDGNKPTMFAPTPYVDYRNMLEAEHNKDNAICTMGPGMQVLAPTCAVDCAAL